jgi:signal transduction histidine kinase
MESGDYSISLLTLQALEMVQLVASEYRAHPVAMDKAVIVDPGSMNLPVKADFALLKRVLGNMVKNALEATPGGGSIRMGVRPEGSRAVFWVHNDQAMPDPVKLQVFKRSFSTKGEGRGLGTYSVKLFTENYLHGAVGFASSHGDGTTFWISLEAATELQ